MNHIKKNFSPLFFMFIMCCSVIFHSTVSAEAAKKTGFIKKNGSWYYYDSKGKKITNWYQSPSGNKYYFGKTGAAKAGLLTINGKRYCFNSKGKMYRKYFYKTGNSIYYLQSNGVMAKGRLKIKGSWYSFNRNTGQLVRNKWYKETNGSYYYAASDGKLVTGFYKPDSYYRYFRESDGKLLTGWQTINGYKYYFKKTNGLRYDDIILKSSSGKSYYFESDGKLAYSKWFSKNGTYYYATSYGVLASGWLSVDGKKYYMNPSTCERETGWITVDGQKYYFDPATGALTTDNEADDNPVGDSSNSDDQNNISFQWPLNSSYSYISSYFGNRQSPGGIGSTNHKGIDIPAPTGTPIYAAASGTIAAMLSPSASGGAGYYIKINHDQSGISTEYMHQSRFNPNLSVGDHVSKGDIIGYVGSTGNSTGPHLHFGVLVNGVNRNPLDYVKKQ